MTVTAASKETTPIAVGTPAPDFTLKDQNDQDFRLADHLGKKPVILFFYPLDWSPTCTNENVCFSQDLSRFGKYGEVAAISVDSVWSHKAWAEQLKLKHRLLSDMHRSVLKAYGMYFAPANIGQRATVILGKDGKVAFVKVNADITKERDYSEVERFLKTLA
ncbi:MAG: redoxin domain-containing protein [Elusimicrobiota bacterium]|jgi:peroxiredoxin